MQLAEVLDVFERLFNAAQHPDIAEVGLYGTDTTSGGGSPAGVRVRDQRGGNMYLWGAAWKGTQTPVDLPELLPPPKHGAQRVAVLAAHLLRTAQLTQFKDWRLVALADLGPTDARGLVPAGISLIGADGSRTLLRATHGAPQSGDPEEEPNPDYRVPSGLSI